jgi:hypothetical protein
LDVVENNKVSKKNDFAVTNSKHERKFSNKTNIQNVTKREDNLGGNPPKIENKKSKTITI